MTTLPDIFRKWLLLPTGGMLRDAANRLIPYRERLIALESQHRALHLANLQLAEEIRQLKAADLADACLVAQEAAVAREQKLQKPTDLDYQILMIHQQLLAEFTDTEPKFREIYERCKPFTMIAIERLYSLYKSVEYVAAAQIPGDLVECGVWRGGSCMLIAATLLSVGESGRRISMFDTFEGHPAPDPERDIDLWGNRAYDDWRHHTHDGQVKGWGLASLDEVRRNLESTGYPDALLCYVKGMVEETAQHNIPERLSLLRLDTDWYASTRAALIHLYPRLVSGGVLILDDYGHYQGQRQAVLEYFSDTSEPLLFHRIDYSCRIAVKR
jgi:O-methyltransferase